MEDTVLLSLNHKDLIEADEEEMSHYLEIMMINKGNAWRNLFLQDVDVFNKNPWEVFNSKNPTFVFVKSRAPETCGRADGSCESGRWRIIGRDKLIKSEETGKFLGFKKILKFYEKTKPREYKRDWVMEEYRLVMNKEAVICKIRLMFVREISFLLAKHFSYLYTSSSYPRLRAKELLPDYAPEDVSNLQMLIDKKDNHWSHWRDVYCVEPSRFIDQSYEDISTVGRFFFVKRTETCGKTDGCDDGCWRIMGRDRVIKSKTGKVLGIKRVFKFCEKVNCWSVFEGDDLVITWTMEEYRLIKKKKQDEVFCVIKLLSQIQLNLLLRR